ncbi:MAG: hypothetical protein H6709_16830, partial [Kofleriaceae bacterium]|nr:hypothetical protein [Kofleriaceae bacterium]
MGARQVSRVAAVGAVALAALAALAALPGDAAAKRLPPPPEPVAHAEPVIVVDLRAGDPEALRPSRAALIDALGGVQGVRVRDDAGLDGALAGEAADLDAASVRAAL